MVMCENWERSFHIKQIHNVSRNQFELLFLLLLCYVQLSIKEFCHFCETYNTHTTKAKMFQDFNHILKLTWCCLSACTLSPPVEMWGARASTSLWKMLCSSTSFSTDGRSWPKPFLFRLSWRGAQNTTLYATRQYESTRLSVNLGYY